jgi:hypothetical protein
MALDIIRVPHDFEVVLDSSEVTGPVAPGSA